jgi:hypothetical protein
MPAISGSVPVTGFVAPTDSADTYAAHTEEWGRGGYRTVADVTERNNIPSGRRKSGMIVQVLSPRKFYELGSGLLDADWFEISIKSCPETVDTLVALQAIPASRCGGVVHVLGYLAAYDGGGFVAVWDSSGTDADNPVLVSRPTDFSTSGVWRQF